MRTRIFGLLAVLSLFVLMALPASAGFYQPDDDFPISLESKGQITNKGRTATVSVTFSCPEGSTLVYVHAVLNQQSGRLSAYGDGGTSAVVCTGLSQTIKVTITARTGVFMNGPASAGADAHYLPSGSSNSYSSHTSGTVRLGK